MSAKDAFLFFLGKRRPSSLADQADYNEVKHDKTESKKHKNPKGVKGESLGRGAGRKKSKDKFWK